MVFKTIEDIEDRKRHFYAVMKFFNRTPLRESAFYLRFQLLEDNDIDFLMSYYEVSDDWQVFKKICRFRNVKSN